MDAETGSPRPEGALLELDLPPPGIDGCSGLAQDDEGAFWTVAERDAALLSFRVSETTGRAARPEVELGRVTRLSESFTEGRDLESLAWLGDGRLAIGTESDPASDAEIILVGRRSGDRVEADGRLELGREPWPGLGPTDNAGVEGLCAAGEWVVAALEAVVVEGATRLAPIAATRLGDRHWRPFRLALTTATGKVSALSCRARGERLEVFAIERHFHVGRVLRFELMPTAGPRDIAPEVVADLAHSLSALPNFEGIELTGDRLLLLTDNQHGERVERTRLFSLTP